MVNSLFMPSRQHNNSRISYFTFYKNRIKLLNIKQLHKKQPF